METENLEKSIKEIFSGRFKYIVPLYQRNFAWRQEQIEQLLQDVYEAYLTNENGNYFIGSLVVLKRANGDYEVIDGQQRLTTLSLITKILRINDAPRLFYDSRPEVEEFFRAFYGSPDGKFEIDYPQTFHMKNAIDYIRTTKLDGKNDGENNGSVTIDSVEESFKTYFSNNVMLVQVEIPQDTDVASYFEIMNNRGEQLQKHEILKSLMMKNLNDYERREFAMIWDACSQMNIPIQKAFDSVEKRKSYFGENYDDFCFPNWSDFNAKQEENHLNENKGGYSIDDIFKTEGNYVRYKSGEGEDDYESDSYSEYRSIIDFPNFLMHVFKVLFSDKNIDIPLNEKFLLSQYGKLKDKIDPKNFIHKLLLCRMVFDRYIVKVVFDKSDNEDGEKWALIRPKRYEKSWKYVNAFDANDEHNRIVKALSMLQVTFRTRIYKTWLFEILNWFDKRFDISSKEDVLDSKKLYKDYIVELDNIILKHYKNELNCSKLEEVVSLTKENSYSLGTNTPHYLFNLIDYLYWVDSNNEGSIFGGENPKKLKDFDFKYWNSVEHHMAREWADRNNVSRREEFIDNIGNLCLISKSTNSRLSDRDVKEKVDTFGNGNLGAKRQIMYNMTKDSDNQYTWTEAKIKKHYNEILELLSRREFILNPSVSANSPNK